MLLALPLTLFAQSITLRGVVKDSIGSPLELANIIATNKAEGTLESYGITDASGRYRLDLTTGITYDIKVSYLGLQSVNEEIIVAQDAQDITKDFTLKEDPNQLDNVELVYEMPVTIKGDTIVYNTDSFTNGTERKLGDVLKKLPGIEVNDDGQIEVEGKVVSKVMIEGKDFFDGDSKLATKNIPADALKKVEVLKNYNEVSQMRGLGNDQDNVAINIKLKEGKTNFWFGDLTAGAGDGEKLRYLGKAKLFYYSPKGSINIITDFNNTGEVPFTFRDYFNFTGGFRNFNQRGGTSFNVSDSGLGFLTTQNNRANEIETGFAAANFTYTINPKWDISGLALLSDNKTNFVNNSLNTFINQGFTQGFNESTDQRNQLGMAKLSSVYKPNANLQFDYDVLVKKSKQTEFSDGTSIVTRDGAVQEDVVDQDKENEPFSINQNVNLYYTLDENNIFSGTIQHLYQDEDPFYNATLSQEPFTAPDPADMTNEISSIDFMPGANGLFDINQNKNIKTNKLDAKLDYYYILNKKSNINITAGTTLSRQDFNSNLFQILETGTVDDLTETLDGTIIGNDVAFNFSDVFVGLHYKLKTGIFTITPGLTLHNYTTKSEQLGTTTEDSDVRLLPDLFTVLDFSQGKSLRVNYQMTAQYTDVNNFAEGLLFNNYNSLYRGNREIENAIYHNASINYFSFSMFNFTSLFGGINYSRRVDPIKTSGSFVGINQVASPINNTNFADQTLSANARFSKRFKKWKLNLSANGSYSDLNNIINGEDRNTKNLTQNYRTSAETNFKEAPNFEIGYNFTSTNSDNGVTDRTFFTNRPFANAEWNFGKGFTIGADWSLYNYDDNDDSTEIDNMYSFLEANIYYQKPDSQWEFRIQATNLLNVDTISSNNVNDFTISNTEYFVQPRIAMFTVKYNL
ncbi:carboxypeptidase family protein [Dokdonia sp. Hel_I_63]|uniref:TonB-dependent receptor n=1 Tax=Dokdonia sp. Hel_I_63 TaxID=1249996 RepID=UPI00119B439D|nr:TonB-dependent receptor [Dokdonia sp. Hel_I_63]TVZ22031.1 carboxypeptidase family protein [Dokdonia sp. Hel_I_63]